MLQHLTSCGALMSSNTTQDTQTDTASKRMQSIKGIKRKKRRKHTTHSKRVGMRNPKQKLSMTLPQQKKISQIIKLYNFCNTSSNLLTGKRVECWWTSQDTGHNTQTSTQPCTAGSCICFISLRLSSFVTHGQIPVSCVPQHKSSLKSTEAVSWLN